VEKSLYLFCFDYGTGGLWYFFRAHKPSDVRRKYPMLVYVEDEPAWMTSEIRDDMMENACFDVDADPSSHRSLEALKRSALEHFASLGEQVLPPRDD
jgi:hypothetical protein